MSLVPGSLACHHCCGLVQKDYFCAVWQLGPAGLAKWTIQMDQNPQRYARRHSVGYLLPTQSGPSLYSTHLTIQNVGDCSCWLICLAQPGFSIMPDKGGQKTCYIQEPSWYIPHHQTDSPAGIVTECPALCWIKQYLWLVSIYTAYMVLDNCTLSQ